MKMKDFKIDLEHKLRYAKEHIKVKDDYYKGYVCAMQDIYYFINDVKYENPDNEERPEVDNT